VREQEGQGKVLAYVLRFGRQERYSLGWVGQVEVQTKGVLCVLWQFCMGEEEGDFGRGGGTPSLVFYYGRLIE
jgi:hypothetical protein